MLQSGSGRPGVLLNSLREISKQGERAGEIISRLRDFVRKGEVGRRPVAINELVRGVLDLLRHEIGAHKIRLRLTLAEGLPLVEADRIQVEQVIFNLVRNAIEAMEATEEQTRELQIKTVRKDGEKPAVEVAVGDTGEGLPADAAKHLFDAFYSTKLNGMGLGLSISRSIVHAHGGRIWASPNNDGGSTFHFTLPVSA
jgi:two-component system, LuxR family, sensor kinase FixL